MGNVSAENKFDQGMYYKAHSIITDPGSFAMFYEALPDGVPEIVKAVQGLIIHYEWAKECGIVLTEEQKTHKCLYKVSDMLHKIYEMCNKPITDKRSISEMLFGSCRDFAVSLCSILRFKGISSRVRSGYARYLSQDKLVSHYICEYLDNKNMKWVQVDAQLDDAQKAALGVHFDTLNIPGEQFMTASAAWLLARTGKLRADTDFEPGMNRWIIRGNLIRDLAAVNKFELRHRHCWGLILKPEEKLTQEDYDLLDNAAYLVSNNKPELFKFYQDNDLLKVPEIVWDFSRGRGCRIRLG